MLPGKSRQTKRRRRARAGLAALEFGLAVPLLVLMLTAIAEIGFSMYQAMQVAYAADAGLAYAAKNGWDPTGITNAAQNSTNLSGISAWTKQFCGCPGASGITAVACDATCTVGNTRTACGQYIRVNASLTRVSLIGVTGFGLPASFSAQSILRQN
jgi:Flp pilus assembly protein TadG